LCLQLATRASTDQSVDQLTWLTSQAMNYDQST
jgi:hypothetical protein